MSALCDSAQWPKRQRERRRRAARQRVEPIYPSDMREHKHATQGAARGSRPGDRYGMIAFGARRVALNQCAAHQGAQCVNVIRKGFSGIAHVGMQFKNLRVNVTIRSVILSTISIV